MLASLLAVGVPHTNQHQTVVTTYFDTALYSTAETDLNIESDLALKTRTTVDQLGRTIKVENAENGSYTISAQTETGVFTVKIRKESTGESSDLR